ncbi:nitrogen fixation protein NifQ [Teredinibacter haidensis]|uniref:nitrogen fixation protein NifQ n=1 Tax=Teredinibacter haidensis TaxID=2731755 RepID=UPI0009F922FC|nr:nitrogen fixation protein NifQ [Teredinibacter haidensis]
MNTLARTLLTDIFPPNTDTFVDIISAQRAGASCLPNTLGLASEQYKTLIHRHLPGIDQLGLARNEHVWENGEIRQELLDLKLEEIQELTQLLLKHRKQKDISEEWLASILSAGCMGNSHLWRDLGLPSRDHLKALIRTNFPTLADLNTQNMRWKKFFYKQLCEQQGHYLCRSPSCDICPSHEECFGEE